MNSLEEWKAARLAALVAEDGWLNLTDRVEIGAGPQRVGRADDNDLVLSVGPEHLGVLTLGDSGAMFQEPGKERQAFQPAPGGFPQLRVPPLLLELHTVDGVPALRVRDLTLKPQVQLRAFPDNPDWVIRAHWESFAPQTTEVAMKGGTVASVTVTNRASFQHQGATVSLTATHWKSGKPMFVFRDATAGETYPACRFLYGEDPSDTEITLDFNRAISPPCAFTDFAICPLPPPGNILPFRIEAGELAP